MREPIPRDVATAYVPMVWPVARVVPLEPGIAPLPIDLARTLANRRSVRAFSALPLAQLGALLWHTCRTLSVAPSPLGFELEQRPPPSAGAIHPVHILVKPLDESWSRYDGRNHQLQVLRTSPEFDGIAHRFRECFDPGEGTLIAFVGEPGMTAAKYKNGESLVYRDAGVLQGTLAIVGEALGINVCLVGATGEPWVASLAQERQLMGVGLGVLGARS